MEFLNFYEMKVVTVGPDTDHDYFAGTEGKSRVDSLRKATTKDAPGTADSSWTTVRTVGGTKKSLCRLKVTRVTGTRVTYESSRATVQTMSTTKETQLPKGENAGITVRTVGIATDGRYCWNQGNLRILVGHGADHEYHEGNAVTERENVGITVRTVGIVNDSRCYRRHGYRPRFHCDHGANRKVSMGVAIDRGFVHPDSGHDDGANRGSYDRVRATMNTREHGSHPGLTVVTV
ncbi:hypothetical protein ACLKA6_009752 [Drosophila palustris]